MFGSDSKTHRRAFLAGASALTVAGCAGSLPPVADRVLISKSTRQLHLLEQNKLLRTYKVHLGFTPAGHKEQRGDGRTPEGSYYVDRRNPRSSYHLSLGLNYPNAADVARAQAMGVDPGNDIFIHGGPRLARDRDREDWTAGCIAVSDNEIEEIWSMVPLGTRVTILA
jgi:murein L,D-transpeptidase YafK